MQQTGVSLSGFVCSHLTVITMDLNNYVTAVFVFPFLINLQTFPNFCFHFVILRHRALIDGTIFNVLHLITTHKLREGAVHDAQCELKCL